MTHDDNTVPARSCVLVVDDVEANLVTARALLEGLDCDVVTARSGNEALRHLLRRDFAVVLLDVQMPGMDGYEVAEHARTNAATRDVPLIFVTATHPSEDRMLRGYVSGAVDVLFKPIDPAVLRSKVRIFLELHAGRRALKELAASEAALAELFRRANEDLQAAYEDLKAMQAQLVQSAKMASLGELVAGVAHEINNPLAFALSHLGTVHKTLKAATPNPGDGSVTLSREGWARVDNRLSEMNTGLLRIRELVLKLRTFARIDEGERKIVDIRECVDSVLTILDHRLEGRIEVETEYAEPYDLDCYPGLLNQALMNVIANALESIPERGHIRLSSVADGERYVIRVQDDGGGIPPHLRDRVCDPFFTTKPVGQGTGLGLAITYSIVRKHGGSIDFSEAPGGGTVVTLDLPRNPRPPAAQSENGS